MGAFEPGLRVRVRFKALRRRVVRAAAPRGPQEFSRSSAILKVYGATPSSNAKEKPTLRMEHRGGLRMSDRRSPSGEPPEVSWGVASRTEHPTNPVERNEA